MIYYSLRLHNIWLNIHKKNMRSLNFILVIYNIVCFQLFFNMVAHKNIAFG